MSFTLTDHARVRMQQRGISPKALELLFELGDVSPAPGGMEMVYAARANRGEIGRRTRCIRERDRVKRLYAITDGQGTVITVGFRFRRHAHA